MLDKLIEELSNDLELETPLRPKSAGVFSIPVGDDKMVTARELDRGYVLEGVVCPMPREGVEDTLIYLMSSGLFGSGSYGASFAVDDEEKTVKAVYRDFYSTDYIDFKEHLEDVINCCDFWEEELKSR